MSRCHILIPQNVDKLIPVHLAFFVVVFFCGTEKSVSFYLPNGEKPLRIIKSLNVQKQVQGT